MWGLFSGAGVESVIWLYGKVNATVYKNIFEQHVIPFIQNNTHCHSAKTVKQFFEVKSIKVIAWLTQSTDFSPIEDL